MNKKAFNKQLMMVLSGILIVIWTIDIFLTVWATEVSKIGHVCLIFLIILYNLIDFIKYLAAYLEDKKNTNEDKDNQGVLLDSQLYFKIVNNENNKVVSYCRSHQTTHLFGTDVIDSDIAEYIKKNDCRLESISKSEYDEHHSNLEKTQVEDKKGLPDDSVVDNTEVKNDVLCGDCKYLMYSDCYGECSKAYKGIVNADDSCGRGVRKGKV